MHTRGRKITSLDPAGPAALGGALEVGDEIVALDGAAVEESVLARALRGADVVGAEVLLTVRRGGRTVEARLARTTAAAVRDAQALLGLAGAVREHAAKLAQRAGGAPELLATAQALADGILKHEKCATPRHATPRHATRAQRWESERRAGTQGAGGGGGAAGGGGVCDAGGRRAARRQGHGRPRAHAPLHGPAQVESL